MLLHRIFFSILLLFSTTVYSQIYFDGDTIKDQTCRRIGLIQLDWTEAIDTSSSGVILYYTVHIDKIIEQKKQKELDRFLDKNLVRGRGDTSVYYFYFSRYDLETLSSLQSHYSLKRGLAARRRAFIRIFGWSSGSLLCLVHPFVGLGAIATTQILIAIEDLKSSRLYIEESVDVQSK